MRSKQDNMTIKHASKQQVIATLAITHLLTRLSNHNHADIQLNGVMTD